MPIEGENIRLESELDDCFYIISSGNVTLKKNGKVVRRLGLGDGFGEVGDLTKIRRTAGIIADKGISLLKINSTAINKGIFELLGAFSEVFTSTDPSPVSHD